MSAVTSSVSVQKVLTAADFPRALVNAIGEATLDQMPQVKVTEEGRGYLDNCFSLGMIPEGGAIKGTDQLGRAFITFAVTNPNYRKIEQERTAAFEAGNHDFPRAIVEETALVTVLQKYADDGKWVHKWALLPTNDFRFWGDRVMNDQKYAMIKDIFKGTHPDLSLYKNQPPADALKE